MKEGVGEGGGEGVFSPQPCHQESPQTSPHVFGSADLSVCCRGREWLGVGWGGWGWDGVS